METNDTGTKNKQLRATLTAPQFKLHLGSHFSHSSHKSPSTPQSPQPKPNLQSTPPPLNTHAWS
uniref:Uncharacterized protein n=1 Tax=Arundo donax TaxID=35708 RepID=A0A0A9RZS2_ARUDO